MPNKACTRRWGVWRDSKHFPTPPAFFQSDGVPPPAPARVTQTVETVEKVTFQKLFLKSGKEKLKSVWFLVFRTTFPQHFGNFLACCGRFF